MTKNKVTKRKNSPTQKNDLEPLATILLVDIPVEFQISKDLLGQSGFREAYRAKSNTQEI